VTVQLAGVSSPSVRYSHYLAPLALVILLAAVIGVVVTIPGRSSQHHYAGTVSRGAARKGPPYWFVRPGDTLSQISMKTGLSIDQLEAFNPQVDPNNLLPGKRLNLWAHPPTPRPPPPGPMFWTVRAGDSFGSIAAKTGINIIKLEKLNPQLKPTSLARGDRVRLRRSGMGTPAATDHLTVGTARIAHG
jgi:LysM repeat protein